MAFGHRGRRHKGDGELWVLAKQAQINSSELQNKLLLAQDSEGSRKGQSRADR